MEGDEDDMEDDYEEDDEEVEYYDDDEEESEGGIVEDIKDVVEDKVDGEKEEVRLGIRGDTIPLFNGSKSGSGIAKRLKIKLQIRNRIITPLQGDSVP